MGAAESSPKNDLSPKALAEARQQLFDRAADIPEVNVHEVEALLRKLGPIAATTVGEQLTYTCRSLQDADLIAFGMLTMLKSRGLTLVTSINLGHNMIANSGAAALGEALSRGAPALLRLQLHENRIGDAGMTALVGSMLPGGAPNLKTLKVEFNAIGDAGMAALAQVWAEGGAQELTDLLAAGNQIGSPGLAALAAQLSHAPKLCFLGFGSSSGGNRIGDDGARALAEALRSQPADRPGKLTINLKTNLLSPDGESAMDGSVKEEKVVAVMDSLRRTVAGVTALRTTGPTVDFAAPSMAPSPSPSPPAPADRHDDAALEA